MNHTELNNQLLSILTSTPRTSDLNFFLTLVRYQIFYITLHYSKISVRPIQDKTPLLTIHLSLIRENDFPTAAWWIYCQSLLEALLDVGTPDAFSVIREIVAITRHVAVIVSADNSVHVTSTGITRIAVVIHSKSWLQWTVVPAERLSPRAPVIHRNK